MQKLLPILLILLTFITSAYRAPEVYTIDATKNAYIHNNLGLTYLKEHCYYAAIQEFKIAISLNSNTQATAVYYSNIGDTYMEIGYPDMARQPYEDAIKQYGLNLKYYQNLAKCYKELKIIPQKINEYSSGENPLNKVMLGILYIENGNLKRGVIILDEFTMKEPDLLITPAVKQYIKETVKKING
jgi:tetratricopeptide (TPR) repeat protein